MHNKLKKVWFVFLFSMIAAFSQAQDFNNGDKAEMADTLRSNGKIYVVVAVVLVILAGLILYVISIDRKISRLEKEKS